MGHIGYDKRNEHCCIVVEGDTVWTIIYWIVIIGPLVGGCDSTMIYCNWNIFKKLKEHSKLTTSLEKNVIAENKEILYFMIIDMLMPICMHSVYHYPKFAIPDRRSLASRQFFMFMYMANAAARGVTIIIMLRPYRNAFKRYFLRMKPSLVGAGKKNAVGPSATSGKTALTDHKV